MSQRSNRLSWALLALLLGLIAGLPTVPAATPSAKVSLGEVSVRLDGTATGRTGELGRELRRALCEELASLAESGTPGRRPVIVSAALTKLQTERRAERARATATISLSLRTADDQVLFAELSGRASAEETAQNVLTAQQAALRGAVRGAVARLPEAVQRAR